MTSMKFSQTMQRCVDRFFCLLIVGFSSITFALDQMERDPVTLFYVTYPTGDMFGKGLGYVSLLPMLLIFYEFFQVFILYCSVALMRKPEQSQLEHDRSKSRKSMVQPDLWVPWPWYETRKDLRNWLTWSLIGQLINELLAKSLKKYYQHPRPPAADRNEYGMPSSHAQFMAFVTISVCARLVEQQLMARYRHASRPPLSTCRLTLLILGLLSLTGLTAYSRVYLQYHYWDQIFVGIEIGIASALVWQLVRWSLSWLAESRFFKILFVPVCEFLL